MNDPDAGPREKVAARLLRIEKTILNGESSHQSPRKPHSTLVVGVPCNVFLNPSSQEQAGYAERQQDMQQQLQLQILMHTATLMTGSQWRSQHHFREILVMLVASCSISSRLPSHSAMCLALNCYLDVLSLRRI